MNRHMMPSKMQGKLHGFRAGGTHNASSQKRMVGDLVTSRPGGKAE